MISYEPANSPFYIANKKYCEGIEHKLKALNPSISGYCNSYGFDVEVSFEKNKLHYNLKFHKHQTTRNGVIVPLNADDKTDTEFTLSGLNKNQKLEIGKSKIRRFFIPGLLRKKLPSPYYISGDMLVSDDLSRLIMENNITGFSLKLGKLKFKINNAVTDPESLIRKIEDLIKDWR